MEKQVTTCFTQSKEFFTVIKSGTLVAIGEVLKLVIIKNKQVGITQKISKLRKTLLTKLLNLLIS